MTSKFIPPMLATAARELPKGEWVAEEKYDGHRLIVAVDAAGLTAWSRLGNVRSLPTQVRQPLLRLLPGVYDGELIVPHGYSSSVTDLANQARLQYVLFDLLEIDGLSTVAQPWFIRRQQLEIATAELSLSPECVHVYLAESTPIRSWRDVENIVDAIWDRGGEGVILKDTNAPYRVGKRTKTFLKVKQCLPAVLTIVGFTPSEGEIQNRGPYGMTVLRDEEGLHTVVKTLNNEELARLTAEGMGLEPIWETVRLPGGAKTKVKMNTNHPWAARRQKLHIEFQERTPDGSYRHPRWDRLEGE